MQQLAKFRPSVKVRYTVLNSVSRNLAAFKIFKVSGAGGESSILVRQNEFVIHSFFWTLSPSQRFLDAQNQTVKDFFKAMDTEGKKEVPTSVFRKALKVRYALESQLIMQHMQPCSVAKCKKSHNEKVLECLGLIMTSRLQDANVPLDLRQIQWMIRKLDRNFTSIIKYRFDTPRTQQSPNGNIGTAFNVRPFLYCSEFSKIKDVATTAKS